MLNFLKNLFKPQVIELVFFKATDCEFRNYYRISGLPTRVFCHAGLSSVLGVAELPPEFILVVASVPFRGSTKVILAITAYNDTIRIDDANNEFREYVNIGTALVSKLQLPKPGKARTFYLAVKTNI